jgi:hypothetical protein
MSYSHQDTALMGQVSNDLQAAGMIVWSDTHLNPGTESWRKAIEQAIDETTCVVVIFSPEAKESKWVTAELDYANTQNKPIFPILARGDKHNAVPFGFTTSQWIDVREAAHYPLEIPRLIAAIRGKPHETTHAGAHQTVSLHTPSATAKEKLDPWNFLHQFRLFMRLFLDPSEFNRRYAAHTDTMLAQTAGWIVVTLCWLPTMMPVIGYTLGTVHVSNPSADNQFLLAAYALFFVGWFAGGLLAGSGNAIGGVVGMVISTITYYLLLAVIGGTGNLILVNINPPFTLFVLTTICVSLGVAAGLALHISNAGISVVVGVVLGTFIFVVTYNMPLGITGGLGGVVLFLTAFAVSFGLTQNVNTGRASWLSRGMMALLVAAYLAMFWVYLLGGWSIVTNL